MTVAFRVRSLSYILGAAILTVITGCSGCSSSTTAPTSSAPYSQTDITVGTGATAAAGNRVTVMYTGWLYDSSQPSGKGRQFETNPSFTFLLGTRAVIAGWDQGVVGMRVGGVRRLVIPPELAYGSSGAGSTIPPNATLVFDITLIAVG
jgi:FKBP-type peptidyl-prolyl cis-trans isomerase FkpA